MHSASFCGAACPCGSSAKAVKPDWHRKDPKEGALSERSIETSGDQLGMVVCRARWALFQDNQSIWDAVLDAARKRIWLEQYIFGTRGVGRHLLDLLAAKARQNVEVRILRRRWRTGAASQRRQMTMFNGVRDLLRNPVGRAHRLHRKTLITDDAHVAVGGTCYQDRTSTWRDTMIRIDGPLMKQRAAMPAPAPWLIRMSDRRWRRKLVRKTCRYTIQIRTISPFKST